MKLFQPWITLCGGFLWPRMINFLSGIKTMKTINQIIFLLCNKLTKFQILRQKSNKIYEILKYIKLSSSLTETFKLDINVDTSLFHHRIYFFKGNCFLFIIILHPFPSFKCHNPNCNLNTVTNSTQHNLSWVKHYCYNTINTTITTET